MRSKDRGILKTCIGFGRNSLLLLFWSFFFFVAQANVTVAFWAYYSRSAAN